MDTITRPDDGHAEARRLLPWYAAGTLDADDRRLVDGHLSGCATCRAELADERRLIAAIGEGGDATAAPAGWAALAARLESAEATALPPLPGAAPRPHRRGRWSRAASLFSDARRLRWVVGVQSAALLVVGGVATLPVERVATYQALGDATAPRGGNVLAMFRPDAREGAIRTLLIEVGARTVDGPTGAGAYVLDVPGGEHGAALARLRRAHDVTMAEPIEQAPAE